MGTKYTKNNFEKILRQAVILSIAGILFHCYFNKKYFLSCKRQEVDPINRQLTVCSFGNRHYQYIDILRENILGHSRYVLLRLDAEEAKLCTDKTKP